MWLFDEKHLPSASFEIFGPVSHLWEALSSKTSMLIPGTQWVLDIVDFDIFGIYLDIFGIYSDRLLVSALGLFWSDFSDVRLSPRIQGRSCSRLSRLGRSTAGGWNWSSRWVLRQNNCNVLQLVWAQESLPRRGPRWYSLRNEQKWTLMCHAMWIQRKASRCFNAPFDVACASQTILTFQDERLYHSY